MPKHKTVFREAIHEMLIQACIELFQRSGITIQRGTRPLSNAEICSMISGTGEGLSLKAFLQPDKKILTAGHPYKQSDVSQDEAEDWCRELNNQLMGRLKTKLLERNCIIDLGLPTLIPSSEISTTRATRASMLTQNFETEFGALKLTNQIELDTSFVLLDKAAASNHVEMHEGDCLLF